MLKHLDSQLDQLWVVIGIITFSLLSGCVSGSRGTTSDEIMRPLQTVRKAVYYAMKDGVKKKSANGRTYISDYHRPGMDLKMSAYMRPKRAVLTMTILGDRRPYEVNIQYTVEKRLNGQYVFDRYDESIANEYLEKVLDYLASRPEERDVIDDFRAY